jgi:uncharacterized membrane protein YoaK (UPF0700 family)
MPRRLATMLYLATVVAGLVDAVSFLGLSRVFVANMTGNVLFVGFAAASAPGVSVSRSLVALGAFVVGSGLGGRLADALEHRRRSWLVRAFGAETFCFAIALVLDASGDVHSNESRRLVLIAVMAAGMGVQNATAARLALPALTTTVLTRTLTGVAAQIFQRQPDLPLLGRRLLAVAAMLVGATLGALLVLRVGIAAGLGLTVALLAVVTVGSLTVEEQGA